MTVGYSVIIETQRYVFFERDEWGVLTWAANEWSENGYWKT